MTPADIITACTEWINRVEMLLLDNCDPGNFVWLAGERQHFISLRAQAEAAQRRLEARSMGNG